MTDKPIKVSATGRAMLTLAATRTDRLVPPQTLPVAAARQVVRSLLNGDLIEEVPAPADEPSFFWCQADDGTPLALRATEAGLAAIGEAAFTLDIPDADAAPDTTSSEVAPQTADAVAPDEALTATVAGLTDAASQDATSPGGPAQSAPEAPARATLRQAAVAVLAAWNDETNRTDIITALSAPMANLHTALGTRVARPATTATRTPRDGTKQSQVLAMLRRPEGATVAQIAEAMTWAPHTVRGFFAGLKKRQGIVVAPTERIRQAGAEGAKGSYTIYRIAEAG